MVEKVRHSLRSENDRTGKIISLYADSPKLDYVFRRLEEVRKEHGERGGEFLEKFLLPEVESMGETPFTNRVKMWHIETLLGRLRASPGSFRREVSEPYERAKPTAPALRLRRKVDSLVKEKWEELEDEGVSALVLIGSVGMGNAKAGADIDLVVGGSDLRLNRLQKIIHPVIGKFNDIIPVSIEEVRKEIREISEAGKDEKVPGRELAYMCANLLKNRPVKSAEGFELGGLQEDIVKAAENNVFLRAGILHNFSTIRAKPLLTGEEHRSS